VVAGVVLEQDLTINVEVIQEAVALLLLGMQSKEILC